MKSKKITECPRCNKVLKKEIGSWSGLKNLTCVPTTENLKEYHLPVIIYEDDPGADIFDFDWS